MKLTKKQHLFADHYLISLNATDAAIKAGYSKKTAGVIGAENLQKPNIRLYIDETLEKKDKERIASADEVLAFLTSVQRGEVTEQTPLVLGREFKVIDKEPSIKDRTKAAELLGKRYSLFTEKHDISADIGLHINVDYGDPDEND